MSQLKKLPTVSNVVNGGTFTIHCPVNLTYAKVKMKLGGTSFLPPNITNLRVKLNGKTVQTFATGTRLNQWNQYYGRPSQAGYLTLYFSQPELREPFRNSTAIGTGLNGEGVVSTMVIQGEISGATAPTLDAYAELLPASPVGMIQKIKEFPFNFAAGQNDVDKLPKGPNIQCVHFYANDITDLEAEIDGQKIYEAETVVGEKLQADYVPKRVPDGTAYSAVDFSLDGSLLDTVTTQGVQDMRFRVTKTAAGAADIAVCYLDGLGGI